MIPMTCERMKPPLPNLPKILAARGKTPIPNRNNRMLQLNTLTVSLPPIVKRPITASITNGNTKSTNFAGMKSFFKFTVSTSEHELTKEKPEMFIRTANQFGLSPDKCIVVEDSLYAIKAAKEAGSAVWAIEDAKHVNDKEIIISTADRYFHNHMEMSRAFRSLFA